MIEEGKGRLSPMSPAEHETLAHHHAGKTVRLACLALVLGDIRVKRVLPAYVEAAAAREAGTNADEPLSMGAAS